MNQHAPISMIDVINAGARGHKTCPWCRAPLELARQVGKRFLVGCESDTCKANPQVGGDTLIEAWANWDEVR